MKGVTRRTLGCYRGWNDCERLDKTKNTEKTHNANIYPKLKAELADAAGDSSGRSTSKVQRDAV